jgi:hypothetical protein
MQVQWQSSHTSGLPSMIAFGAAAVGATTTEAGVAGGGPGTGTSGLIRMQMGSTDDNVFNECYTRIRFDLIETCRFNLIETIKC